MSLGLIAELSMLFAFVAIAKKLSFDNSKMRSVDLSLSLRSVMIW